MAPVVAVAVMVPVAVPVTAMAVLVPVVMPVVMAVTPVTVTMVVTVMSVVALVPDPLDGHLDHLGLMDRRGGTVRHDQQERGEQAEDEEGEPRTATHGAGEHLDFLVGTAPSTADREQA